MSAPLAPLAMKVVGGAVVSKLVGKVTGNEKLGMIAGLATGFALPAGAAGAAAGAGGGMGAGMAEAGVAATGAAVPGATTAATGIGGTLAKAGGMLSKGAGWVGANPMAAMMGAQAVGGAVQGYEARKLAAAQRAHDLKLQELDHAEAQADYERTHQPLRSGYQLGGSSSSTLPQRPMSAPEQYFKQYNDMYSGRVR